MKIKLHDVLIWVAIVFVFFVACVGPTDSDFEELEKKVDAQRKIIKEQTKTITAMTAVVRENAEIIDENVELIDSMYQCNPYCSY